jgi:hypothetical protein
MRYPLAFICACALAMILLAGCSDSGDSVPGGSGGEGSAAGTGGSAGAAGTGGGEFVADAPVRASVSNPLADCEPEVDWIVSETEPWVAVNPTDPENIVGVWMQDMVGDPLRGRGNVASVSFDGGATWKSVAIPGLTACTGGDFEDTVDPWVTFAANGDLYSMSMMQRPSALLVNKSFDGGLTWSDPVTIATAEAPMFHDKPSITADPFDECSIYVPWTRFPQRGASSDRKMFFTRTTDCGETWEEASLLQDSFGMGLQVVVLPDGTLLAFYRGPEGIFFKRSTDQGDTWQDDAVPVAEQFGLRAQPQTPDLNQQVRASNMFDVAVDRESGALYVVWEQVFEEVALIPLQFAFSRSTDSGVTWSAPVRIDKTPFDMNPLLRQAFLPSVAVASDGTIGVTYYNFENDTAGEPPSSSDHWFIHCDPAEVDCADATRWSDAIRLSEESFDYLTAPVVPRGLFLGDYVGLAAVESDFVAMFPVSTEADSAHVLSVRIRALDPSK